MSKRSSSQRYLAALRWINAVTLRVIAPPAMSEGDRRLLAGLADGMRVPQLAVAEGVSLSSVRKRLRRLREYYGAETDAQLVYRAILDAAIEPY